MLEPVVAARVMRKEGERDERVGAGHLIERGGRIWLPVAHGDGHLELAARPPPAPPRAARALPARRWAWSSVKRRSGDPPPIWR